MKMLEICSPARLNVLLGEVQVTVMAAASAEREAKGVWQKPGRTNSS